MEDFVPAKNSDELARIIKDYDILAFDEMFPSKEDLISYRDDQPPFGNILHALARFGDADFTETVCEYSAHKYGDDFQALFFEKDINGDIPAITALKRVATLETDQSPANKKEKKTAMEHVKDARKVATLLKFHTELARLPQNEHNDYIARGPKYQHGYPLETIKSDEKEYAFTITRPVVPQTVLVNLKNGLRPDQKSDETPEPEIVEGEFINLEDEVDNGQIQGINRGKYATAQNLSPYGKSPKEQFEENIPFADDYGAAKTALNLVAKAVHASLADENFSALYRNFFKKGGLIAIEDKGKRFFLGNLKDANGKYRGSAIWKTDHQYNKFPLVTINAASFVNPDGTPRVSSYKELKNTMDHEITHTADLDVSRKPHFSELPISRYFFALEAGRGPHGLGINDPNYRVFAKLADYYKPSSFYLESLANFMAMDENDKDPLTKEYRKIFLSYIRAKSNNDEKVVKLVENSHTMLTDMERLKGMYLKLETRLQINHDFVYTDENQTKEIDGPLAKRMLDDLKKINRQIATIEKPLSIEENNARNVYLKDDHSPDKFREVFEKTSKAATGKDLGKLHKMLQEAVSGIDKSGVDPLHMFKTGIIYTAITDKLNIEGKSELAFNMETSSAFLHTDNNDFNSTTKNEHDNTIALLKDARRTCLVLSELKAGKISETTARIAIDTGLKAANIETVIENVDDKMRDMTVDDARTVLRTCLENTPPKSPLELIKTIRIAENLSAKSAEPAALSLDTVYPKDLLDKDAFEKTFKDEMMKMATAPMKTEEFKGKTYKSGAKQLLLVDNLRRRDSMQTR